MGSSKVAPSVAAAWRHQIDDAALQAINHSQSAQSDNLDCIAAPSVARLFLRVRKLPHSASWRKTKSTTIWLVESAATQIVWSFHRVSFSHSPRIVSAQPGAALGDGQASGSQRPSLSTKPMTCN